MDELIVRVLGGDATPLEIERLERWRAASPANEGRFQEWSRIWLRTEALARETEPGPIPPEMQRLISGRGRVLSFGPRAERAVRRPGAWLPRAAAAAVLLLVGGASGSWVAGIRSPSPSFGVEELRTQRDEVATAQLVDGTVIRLAPESRLRVGGAGRERSVWLEGRAFLAVHHDPSRPFEVTTPAGKALVLGTRFDIQVRKEGLQVSVVEGTVALDAGPGPVRVEAGHVARLTNGTDIQVDRTDDILRRVDWLGDFLAFERTPLSQVALEVGRLYGVQVEIRDPSLRSRTVTGVYEGRTFQQAMEVICLVVGAHCEVGARRAIIGP